MEIAHGALAIQLGVVDGHRNGDRSGASRIAVAQRVRHDLQRIRAQAVVVVDERVVSWARGALINLKSNFK